MSLRDLAASRRRFRAGMSAMGLGSTLLPGVLWAQIDGSGAADQQIRLLAASAR